MRFCFDLDGTLCSNTEGSYLDATPFQSRINVVNELYDKGHTIYIQTARGFDTKKDWTVVTKKQLNDWGVKYHDLFFNKASADAYIDDKCVFPQEFFGEL